MNTQTEEKPVDILDLPLSDLRALVVDRYGESGHEWNVDAAGRYYVDVSANLLDPGSETVRYFLPAFLQQMLAAEYERGQWDAKRAVRAALGIEEPGR